MSFDEIMAELPKLSPEERQKIRLHLARLDGEQWLSGDDPLTDAKKALLDARLVTYENDPDAGSSWAEVEARLFGRAKTGVRDETGVENAHPPAHFPAMAMSVEQIVNEARLLPREQAAELFDRLLVETLGHPDSEIDAAWRKEIQQRIADIESGREAGVDGDVVMAELRKITGR